MNITSLEQYVFYPKTQKYSLATIVKECRKINFSLEKFMKSTSLYTNEDYESKADVQNTRNIFQYVLKFIAWVGKLIGKLIAWIKSWFKKNTIQSQANYEKLPKVKIQFYNRIESMKKLIKEKPDEFIIPDAYTFDLDKIMKIEIFEEIAEKTKKEVEKTHTLLKNYIEDEDDLKRDVLHDSRQIREIKEWIGQLYDKDVDSFLYEHYGIKAHQDVNIAQVFGDKLDYFSPSWSHAVLGVAIYIGIANKKLKELEDIKKRYEKFLDELKKDLERKKFDQKRIDSLKLINSGISNNLDILTKQVNLIEQATKKLVDYRNDFLAKVDRVIKELTKSSTNSNQ